MSQVNFLSAIVDSIEASTGGRVTSSFRSPEEQERLFQAGKTPLRGGQSAHNRGDKENPHAVDLVNFKGTKEQLKAKLAAQGHPNAHVIWETGKGKNQGTGAHWHIELNGKGNGGSVESVDLPPSRYDKRASPQEKSAMAEQKEFEIVNPFAVGADLKSQTSKVQSRATEADDMLQNVISRIDSSTEQRRQQMEATVTAKTAINDEIQNESREILAKAKPIFQRREAIANRQVEMSQMNPIERFVKGVADPNYNPVHLRAMEKAQSNQVNVLAENFRTLNQFQGTLLSSLQAEQNDQDSLLKFEIDDANQDARLAIGALSTANSEMAATVSAMTNQQRVEALKTQTRLQVLGELSIEQTNTALAEAKENGKSAVVNGVEIPLGYLQDQDAKNQQQILGLRSREIAIQQQEMNLADSLAQNVVAEMSTAQITQAIQNDGEYQGQKLPLDILTAGLVNAQQRDAALVQEAQFQGVAPLFGQQAANIMDSGKASLARVKSLGGIVPPQMATMLTSQAARIEQMSQQIQAAGDEDVKLAATFLQEFQLMAEQQDAMIDSVAQRWGGGSKPMTNVAQAYLRGEPITQGAALDGIIHMAQNGLPANVKMTGAAGQAMRAAQGAVAEYEQILDKPNLSINAPEKTAKQKARELREHVAKKVRGAFVNSNLNQAVSNAPTLAKGVKLDGQAHPFSQVSEADWDNAVATGDSQGYAVLASQLGINAREARIMLSGGKGAEEIWNAVKQRNAPDGVPYAQIGLDSLKRSLVAAQTQETLKLIDDSPSANASFKPSTAYADLMNNGEFMQAIAKGVESTTRGDFGSYIAGTIGVDGFLNGLQNYALTVRSAANSYRNAETARIREAGKRYNQDPFTQTSMVLGAIDGLSESDEKKLLGAIKTMVGDVPGQSALHRAAVGGRTPHGRQGAHDDANEKIDELIMSGKFDDPDLERIRKVAAGQWREMRPRIDRSWKRYLGFGDN